MLVHCLFLFIQFAQTLLKNTNFLLHLSILTIYLFKIILCLFSSLNLFLRSSFESTILASDRFNFKSFDLEFSFYFFDINKYILLIIACMLIFDLVGSLKCIFWF